MGFPGNNLRDNQFMNPKGTTTMLQDSLRTIVASLVPHVGDALQTSLKEFVTAESPLQRMMARSYIEGYLRSAYHSGNLLTAHCDRLLDEIKTPDGCRIIAGLFEPVTTINAGERSLHRWQYKLAGDFERALWGTIGAADPENLAVLANAFPEHVAAYQKYARTPGWWVALKARIDGGE